MKKLLLIFVTILSSLVMNAQNHDDLWFEQHKDSIVNYNNLIPIIPNLSNRGCGQPCTNPGFEFGIGFWDYETGTACNQPQPCVPIAGFNATQHVIQTVGGFDPIVGAALPVVSPGGGNQSLMLGNGPVNGYGAAKASMSFDVTAASASFTYKYAVVLQDPLTGHTDPYRPYFRVKIKDQAGNYIQCGDYEVLAKPPFVGFIYAGSNIWYKQWTTVFVPLSSYIGQCVTIEFTSSDCAYGGHYGYAYIDADCAPLAILTTSPTNCGKPDTLNAPLGAASYLWTNLTGGGTSGIVGPNINQQVIVNQSGTYQVVMTSVSGPTCITTLTVVVTIGPPPPIANFISNNVCQGTPTQFTDQSTPLGSITNWYWDLNNDGVTDNNTQSPSYTYPNAGNYVVTLIVSQGPCNDTTTGNLTVYPNPIVDFIVDKPKGCPIHCVQFTNQSIIDPPDNITNWDWDLGDGTLTNTQNPSHCYNTGKYDITLTVTSNHGCKSSKTIPQMIEVFSYPTAEFFPTPNPVSSLNPFVTMINQSSSDVVYWNWNFGDGQSSSNNVTPNPFHTYPNTMNVTYMVTLIVQNADGCWDTISHPLIIGPEFTFYIPNAFTPNEDGINDDFNGYGIGIVEYDIWIYDRWGNMIFHTDRPYPYDAWDGKANYGKHIAQQDVYVWKVVLKDIFGKKHKYIGTVTLVK